MTLKVGFVGDKGYFLTRKPVPETGISVQVPFKEGTAKVGDNTVLVENGVFPVTVGQVRMDGTEISVKERRGEETVRHPCERLILSDGKVVPEDLDLDEVIPELILALEESRKRIEALEKEMKRLGDRVCGKKLLTARKEI